MAQHVKYCKRLRQADVRERGTVFKAGFFGAKGKGGTKDAATGYIAPLSNEALAWNASYTYRYALIMGNLPDIRTVACSLK